MLAALLSSSALADHGEVETQLTGTTLCVGPLSVQADVRGPEGAAWPAAEPTLREHLETTLRRADVPYDLRESCARARAAVSLSVEARYLDPETYIGFPENAYTYVVTAQVGTLTDAAAEAGVLERPLYSATTSDIVSLQGDAAPLLNVADAVLADLAQAWREDNAVPLAHLLLLAGLGLVLAGVRVALRLVF